MAFNPNRNYVSSHFALELDDGGEHLGFIKTLEGGNVKAEVVTYQMGHALDLWRQIGKSKYDDMSLQVNMAMSPRFYTWISAFFSRDVQRRSGAIVVADFDYWERGRRTFSEALISEVGVPACDASSKDASYLTIKMVPESVNYQPVLKGAKISAPPGSKQQGKLWLACNFSFTIDGIPEAACKRIQKIDAFTIKQKILEHPSGHRTFPLRIPGNLEFPNLTIYVAAVDAQPFMDMVKARVQDYGDKPGGGAGLTGSLGLLGTDLVELGRIDLAGVDVVSFEPEKYEGSSENMARIKVQLQVESMRFTYAGGMTA